MSRFGCQDPACPCHDFTPVEKAFFEAGDQGDMNQEIEEYQAEQARRYYTPIEQVKAVAAPAVVAPIGLPKDDKARKGLPVFRGPLMYFPDAILAVAAVCKAGNDQHNPGEPLHWAREKSTEHMDTAMRHMMDHGLGNVRDIDGTWHLAKAAWRILAELQLTIERETAR